MAWKPIAPPGRPAGYVRTVVDGRTVFKLRDFPDRPGFSGVFAFGAKAPTWGKGERSALANSYEERARKAVEEAFRAEREELESDFRKLVEPQLVRTREELRASKRDRREQSRLTFHATLDGRTIEARAAREEADKLLSEAGFLSGKRGRVRVVEPRVRKDPRKTTSIDQAYRAANGAGGQSTRVHRSEF